MSPDATPDATSRLWASIKPSNRKEFLVETGEAPSLATPHRFSVSFPGRPEWGAYIVAWREAA